MTLDRIAKGVSVDGEKESPRTELCYTPTLKVEEIRKCQRLRREWPGK